MAGPSVRFSRVRPGRGAPTGDTMVKIRKALICALSAVLVVFSAGVAGAQTDYPNRPIHFIVGFAAGGGNDLFARLVVQKFQENTGATAVIENKVGAGAASRRTLRHISLPMAIPFWLVPRDKCRLRPR